MKGLNVAVFLVLVNTVFCQVYQPIIFPEKVDKKYVFNPLKEQEKYMKKVKKSIPGKYLEQYTFNQTFGKSELFTNGDIYLSWPAMETYVNQILDSIIPGSLTSKKIRAYIGRSSSINAFCLYDGTMIVNVGLLAEVKSEAALACIMGHELGHFIKNHHLNDFKKKIKNANKGFGNDLKNMSHSQENELESDQEGFAIAKSAGYDIEEGGSNFELFIREKEYYEKRYKSSLANTDSVTITTKAGKYKVNTLEKLLSTHPDMKDRKEKLNLFIKANPQTKKTKFKIDEDYFMGLQAQARLECIGLIFNNNDYQECLERAFIYHLFTPGELSYSYYIAESVRRLCILDFRLRKRGFLSEKLVEEGFREGEGILHDLKFLIPNAEKYSQINAKDLVSKQPLFETYKEAFYYFTNRLLDKKYQEALLMRALFENNPDKINDNVDQYLASPNAKHKDYADNYRSKTLTEKIATNTNEIVMIPKVEFYRNSVFNAKYTYGSTAYYYKKSEMIGKEMSNEFAQAFNAECHDVKTISLPLAATESFNTKYKYETILNRTLLAKRDENEGYDVVHYYKNLEDEDYIGKIDIFRLDPEVWEFFNTNKVNAITHASYTRHVNSAAKKLRIIYLFMGPVGWILAAGTAINYKKLAMFSYDAKLGTLYYDYNVKSRRLNAKKALKMFQSLKEDKIEYIKEYNEKY